MSNTVTLCENALDPSTWVTHDNVGDVRDFLVDHFGIWPDTARIYLDHVANNADITPHDEAGIERLGKVKGHFYVVVYPEGITIILLIVALVIAATSIALVFLYRPTPKKGQNEDSPNNQLSNRSNEARPNERIPDIYGQLQATFDLLAVPYRTFENNQEIEHCYMCVGRGQYQVNASDVFDDITPIQEIDGTSLAVYSPFKSPNRSTDVPQLQIGAAINEPVVNLQIFDSVNGQILRPPNLDNYLGSGNIRFVSPNKIQNNSGFDFTTQFAIGDLLTVGGNSINDDLAVDSGGVQPSVHLGVTAAISGISASEIDLVNPASSNANWNALAAFSGGASTYRSINLIANGAFKAGPFTILNASMTGFWCNFVAPQGMYIIDKKGRQVQWGAGIQVTVTQCDSSGVAIGSPRTYRVRVAGNKTDRQSKGSTLKIPISPQFGFGGIIVEAQRVTNTDPPSRGNTVVDQVQWRDAYIVSDVKLQDFGNVTTVQSKTIPTLAALAVKQRKLNALVTRMIPHWTGVGTAFSANVATKNAADIICAMALDSFIGNRIASELDLVNIYQTAGAGGDIETYFSNSAMTEFCYTFDDSKVSFEESLSDVAQAIFCVAYRRGNVLTLSFEKATNNSVLLFNHRNKLPRTETRTVTFGSVEDNDGISLDYVEPNAPNYPNVDTIVTLYFPTDQSAKNPKKVTAIGIRNKSQALAFGWRLYNKLIYQNVVVEFEATEEAALLVLQDRILVADNTRSDTQDGEVIDQTALLLTLSQDVIFDGVSTYSIFLQSADGTVESIGITPGAQANKVVLASAPTLPCVIDPDKYARTSYQIVSSAPTRSSAFLLSEKTPKDGKTYSIKAVNYAPEYYSQDTAGAGGGLNPSSVFMPTTHGAILGPGSDPVWGNAFVGPDTGELDQWTSRPLGFWGTSLEWTFSPAGAYGAPGSDALGVLPRSQITSVFVVGVAQQNGGAVANLGYALDGPGGSHGGNVAGIIPNNIDSNKRSFAVDVTAQIISLAGSIAAFDFSRITFDASITTSLFLDLPHPGMVLTFEGLGVLIVFNGGGPPSRNTILTPGSSITGYILNPTNPLSQSSPTQINMAAVGVTYLPNQIDVTFNARSFVIADPGATPVNYYVIVTDTAFTGDSFATLHSRISTTPGDFSIGEVTIGPILAIHGSSTPPTGGGSGGSGTPATGNTDGGTIFRFILTPSRGDFSFAHGLGVAPVDVRVDNCSNGVIRLQNAPNPPWDTTNVYLNASADGLTAFLVVTV